MTVQKFIEDKQYESDDAAAAVKSPENIDRSSLLEYNDAPSLLLLGKEAELKQLLTVERDSRSLSGVPDDESIHAIDSVAEASAFIKSETDTTEFVVVIDRDFETGGLAAVQKLRTAAEGRVAGSVAGLGVGIGVVLITPDKLTEGQKTLARELGAIEPLSRPFSAQQLAKACENAAAAAKRRTERLRVIDYLRSAAAHPEGLPYAATKIKQNLGILGEQKADAIKTVFEPHGRYQEALELILLARRDDPDNLALVNAGARQLLLLGRSKEAVKLFEHLDAIAPANLARMELMAKTYLALERPGEATATIRKIMNLSPEDKDAKYGWVASLIDTGFATHARELAGSTSHLFELVRYYNNRGVAMSRQKLPLEAIVSYKHAEALHPNFPDLYKVIFNRALAHEAIGDDENIKEANKAYALCLQMRPDFSKAERLGLRADKPREDKEPESVVHFDSGVKRIEPFKPAVAGTKAPGKDVATKATAENSTIADTALKEPPVNVADAADDGETLGGSNDGEAVL